MCKLFWSIGLTNGSLMFLQQKDWVLIPSEKYGRKYLQEIFSMEQEVP